jgi:HlyD family secretion protein
MPKTMPNHDLPVLRGPMVTASADDFLPPLGGWSRCLGTRLAAIGGLGLLVMTVLPWQETVRAQGVVRPIGENTVVQSERGGTVLEVLVRPNQAVTAGQAIARLDDRPWRDQQRRLQSDLLKLELQRNQAGLQLQALSLQTGASSDLSGAQVEASRRDVDKASSTVAFHQQEVARYESLLASGAVAQALVDEKRAQLQLSRSELEKANQQVIQQGALGSVEQARLQQSGSSSRSGVEELNKMISLRQTELADVNRALASTVLRAPATGSLLEIAVRHRGQVLRPGDVVATIAPSTGPLQVNLQVPGTEITPIRTGQTTHLRVEGCPYPDFGVLPARVAAIAADAQQTAAPSNGTASPGSYQVVVRPDRTELVQRQRRCGLRPGMQVQADVVTRSTSAMGALLRKLRVLQPL